VLINLDVKKYSLSSKYSLSFPNEASGITKYNSVKMDINPWVISFGAGYRF
jgi:outer membrane protein W